MEQLIVNIPERKSALIKELLIEPGATIQQNSGADDAYKSSLLSVSVWSDEDVTIIEESKKSFENLKPATFPSTYLLPL